MPKMSKESLRRLGELNRSRLKTSTGRPTVHRGVPEHGLARSTILNGASQEFIDPPEELPGQEMQTESGKFLLIKRNLSDIWGAAERFVAHYRLVFERGAIGVDIESLHPDLRQFCEVDQRRLVYLDIETCGLSAAPVFLVGFQYLKGAQMVLEQLLARDYSEERAVLEYFWGKMADCDAVVTFNGKSFDVPFLRDRAVYHGVPFSEPGFHLDLLHEARRRYRAEFPNCKLQTLEARVCGRLRRGDIPGGMIPKAYHDFVRTRDSQTIRNVVHHNALDVVTMSEVLLRILSGL